MLVKLTQDLEVVLKGEVNHGRHTSKSYVRVHFWEFVVHT